MTMLSATRASFAAVLAKAQPGDTVALAAGAYGDVSINKKTFSPAVMLTSADPAHPATFRTININNSAGLNFDRIAVAFTPDATTKAWTPAVIVQNSHDVSLSRSTVIGGPAVNGVPQTASALDATQNVLGLPCGHGVAITASQDVSLTDNEIAQFEHLIELSHVARVLIQHNDLHDRRKTAIAGGDVTDVTVDGNTIRTATPWRWGVPEPHDHADCLAFWSAAGQTTPNARVTISNNTMAQLAGAAILGMWFQGGTDGKSPFTDFRIVGNTLLIPNLQGIMLNNCDGGLIARNTLIQAQLASIPDVDKPKQRPAILLLGGVTGVAVKDNAVSRVTQDTSGGVNAETGTVLLTGQLVGS